MGVLNRWLKSCPSTLIVALSLVLRRIAPNDFPVVEAISIRSNALNGTLDTPISQILDTPIQRILRSQRWIVHMILSYVIPYWTNLNHSSWNVFLCKCVCVCVSYSGIKPQTFRPLSISGKKGHTYAEVLARGETGSRMNEWDTHGQCALNGM